jgi:NitT/TauT family transport system substrate-binding protein
MGRINQALRMGTIIVAIVAAAAAQAADTIRVAVQKTGTFTWELDVIRAHGLDRQFNLNIAVTELANPEAGKIALRGGAADFIVSDWLWVTRERSLGAKLVFYPYSSALGAVMVPVAAPIENLASLKGKKLAVAGGPLDKSWLFVQAAMKQDGIDLKTQATIVYGAPALLAAKAVQREVDATLNYWNFCAALESKGLRRLAGVEEFLPQLGAKGRPALLGYVFDESWASRNRELVARFIAVTRKAKEILATSDAEWERIARLVAPGDAASLNNYRDRYREGIPRRPIAEEEADARILYQVLASVGGSDLVGPARELQPGTFYQPIAGD